MTTCDYCGSLFAAPRGGRYCRPACRTAAWKRDRDAAHAAETDRLRALLVVFREPAS